MSPAFRHRGFNKQIFGANKQAPKGGCGLCPKNDPPRVIDDGCKQEVFGPPVTQSGRADTATLDPLCLTCPGRQWLGLFPSMASMNKSLAQINKLPKVAAVWSAPQTVDRLQVG